jgi:hypothetical protein
MLEVVSSKNRAIRNSVQHWITNQAINDSIFGYGMTRNPMAFSKKVDGDTGEAPIQHDFVTQLGARLEANGQKVRFMEIGVSVLKSIHAQSNYFHGASVTAVDIEDPNPTIEGLWTNKRFVDRWKETSLGRQDMRLEKRPNNYVARYDGPHGNTVNYVTGDSRNSFTWTNLAKSITGLHGPMNLILSDGYHTGDNVKIELDHLLNNKIIVNEGADQHFALVWDDCDSGIRGAVLNNLFPRLREVFAGHRTCAGTFMINGWIGPREGKHNTCVFTTLDLSGPHMQASDTWVPKDPKVSCH